jgi:hypothetical protein
MISAKKNLITLYLYIFLMAELIALWTIIKIQLIYIQLAFDKN